MHEYDGHPGDARYDDNAGDRYDQPYEEHRQGEQGENQGNA
jgi:hypothetical protein